MKKVVVLLALFLISAFAAFFYFSYGQRNFSGSPSVTVNNHKFSVEIADEPGERSRGLGERESICDDCGMLFLFDNPGQYAFWMKDMKFPLDFIWIAGNRVIGVDKNIPPDYSGILKPEIPVDKVLEINAGVREKRKIEIGDEIKIDLGSRKGE